MQKVSDDGQIALYARKPGKALLLAAAGAAIIMYSFDAGHSWFEYLLGSAMFAGGAFAVGYREQLEMNFVSKALRYRNGWFNVPLRDIKRPFSTIRSIKIVESTVSSTEGEKEVTLTSWRIRLEGMLRREMVLGIFHSLPDAQREATALAEQLGTKLEQKVTAPAPVIAPTAE